MRTDVMFVSKDECIFMALVGVFKEEKEPWIFCHEKMVEELKKAADKIYLTNQSYELRVNKEHRPRIWIEEWPENGGKWYKVRSMTDDTGFRSCAKTPSKIVFMKMH